MPAVLSVSRAAVEPGNEAAYLVALRELARGLRERGQRLWVFRHPLRPGSYLECSEGRDPVSHRAGTAPDPALEPLERRLRSLAVYSPEAWDLWTEVSLEEEGRG